MYVQCKIDRFKKKKVKIIFHIYQIINNFKKALDILNVKTPVYCAKNAHCTYNIRLLSEVPIKHCHLYRTNLNIRPIILPHAVKFFLNCSEWRRAAEELKVKGKCARFL